MLYFYDGECKKLCPLVGFLLGIMAFVIVYGIKVLNPFYTDWLLGRGDLSQHYLGWEFYCQDIWRFPIGMTNRLAYPIETSVIFTDSIPIFAILFKLLSQFFEQPFQYFGLWGIMCFGLQGYISVKIFNIWCMDYRCALIGTIFIILAPIMIYRMFMHTSLGAQWIILVAIYLFLTHDSQCGFHRKEILHWCILGGLTAGVHLYFMPMCFLFLVGSIAKDAINSKQLKLGLMVPVGGYILGVCSNLYLLGGFTSHAIDTGEGLGNFGLNLNSFINSNGFSRILPDLGQCGGGQHEGFAYLGLGVICMSIVCMLSFAFPQPFMRKKVHENFIVIIGISTICFLAAVLPRITYGENVLLEIHLPQKISELYAVFRSTGRFIWPVWYLIVLYCVRRIARLVFKKGVNINLCILGICLAIQIFDISLSLASRNEMFSEEITYEYTNDDFWQKLSEYRNFNCVCFSYQGINIEYSIQIGVQALKHNWVMNSFYFARDIDGLWDNTGVLKYESPKSDCIYVFLPDQHEMLQDLENELRYYRIGELVIGVTWLDDNGNVNDFSYE